MSWKAVYDIILGNFHHLLFNVYLFVSMLLNMSFYFIYMFYIFLHKQENFPHILISDFLQINNISQVKHCMFDIK